MVNDLCWYAEHGLAACFSKSKVSTAPIFRVPELKLDYKVFVACTDQETDL